MPYITSLRAVVLGLLTIIGTATGALLLSNNPQADMRVEPTEATLVLNETITIFVIVETNTPANAFTGELVFDNTRFTVEDISYNTSIADLWVREPWFNRAENSVYFAGGTTAPNGFLGTGQLLEITLRALKEGDTIITLKDARVLAHDGLGSDISVRIPIDALFTAEVDEEHTVVSPVADSRYFTVVPEPPALDINEDGELSFQDVSVLLLNLNSDDERFDFNGDGAVTWTDVGTWQRLHDTQR